MKKKIQQFKEKIQIIDKIYDKLQFTHLWFNQNLNFLLVV